MKKSIAGGVRPGTIVRFNGEWGVIERLDPFTHRAPRVRFDRWLGPPIPLGLNELVDEPGPQPPRTKHGTAGSRRCRCRACMDARNEYERKRHAERSLT